MGENKTRSYSKELKEQIIKECIETNNYNAVARKHTIPPNTVYTWVRKDKNKYRHKKDKTQRALENELADVKLENKVLKELLKKTNQLWLKESR